VNFTPLSASPETLSNFFYKGKNTMHLCKECEKLIYMASFGFTKVPRDKRFLFVYIPQKVQDMLRINRNLRERRWITKDLLMESLVEVAKSIESSKADWALKNIYVVEVQVVGDAKSNIHTFSLSPELAKAMREKIEDYPKGLNPIFDLFLQYIYHRRSLYQMLYRIVSGYLYADSYKDIDTSTPEGRLIDFGRKGLYASFLYLINFQEVLNMERDVSKEVNWAFVEGKKLANAYRESLGGERASKKVETLSYRLLEAVRRKDADHFSQNLIRAYLEVEKPIPPVFLNALKEGGLERIAYAFLIGLNGKEGNLEPEGEAQEGLGQE
ncbi:MAG: type I-B CRISPR-associated protein Cas8b1/Cst1, partial [Aquificaceae bacterium]|nr:type I-B CRISPR-associated protein Cas8b1/Cst1 [Aquificaceae bacterium]